MINERLLWNILNNTNWCEVFITQNMFIEALIKHILEHILPYLISQIYATIQHFVLPKIIKKQELLFTKGNQLNHHQDYGMYN